MLSDVEKKTKTSGVHVLPISPYPRILADLCDHSFKHQNRGYPAVFSTVCKGSIRVSYGVCTVSVRRRCMAVPLRTARVNDDGFTDNRDATTVWRNNCSGPGTIILKVIFLCVNGA